MGVEIFPSDLKMFKADVIIIDDFTSIEETLTVRFPVLLDFVQCLQAIVERCPVKFRITIFLETGETTRFIICRDSAIIFPDL
jgi:hypothetical protein